MHLVGADTRPTALDPGNTARQDGPYLEHRGRDGDLCLVADHDGISSAAPSTACYKLAP